MVLSPYIYDRPGISIRSDGRTHALVWSPLARKVEVLPGDGAPIDLEPGAFGYFEGRDLKLNVGDTYKLRVDGGDAFPDPASLWQPQGVHGPSRVIDLGDFVWSDAQWRSPDLEDLIIYELHVGTFSKKGDFEGIEERLDELVELGITAIELMPVAQFPGPRNWGYDGAFPYAVQSEYGGPKGLQKLINVCHQKGLAVILDVVYNHLGPEGNYLSQFGPYFTNKYQTPWGSAINFDDAWCDGVRHYFIQNALMWLRDFHVDGLRLDAVHAIYDNSTHHILAQLKEAVEALNRSDGHNHFLIAECDLNDVKYLKPSSQGGYAMDAQWCDEFHHALHAQVTGETKGYYSDFGGMDFLEKTLKNGFVYDGIWSPHRKKIFGSPTHELAPSRLVVFSQNHDQVGNRMLGDRLSALLDYERLKLVAGFTLLSPYTPLLFMGEEYGEMNPFLYFTSHGDPQLIEAVRTGRQNEFKDFIKDEKAPDPQREETFQNSRLTDRSRWSDDQQMLRVFYQKLIQLRKSVITGNNDQGRETVRKAPEVLSIAYHSVSQSILITFNFGEGSYKMPLPQGKYQLLFYSADPEWGGHGEEPLDANADAEAPEQSLTGFSFSVLQQKLHRKK
jgi:maltooligosyltrehalose trehalohydrolase